MNTYLLEYCLTTRQDRNIKVSIHILDLYPRPLRGGDEMEGRGGEEKVESQMLRGRIPGISEKTRPFQANRECRRSFLCSFFLWGV